MTSQKIDTSLNRTVLLFGTAVFSALRNFELQNLTEWRTEFAKTVCHGKLMPSLCHVLLNAMCRLMSKSCSCEIHCVDIF